MSNTIQVKRRNYLYKKGDVYRCIDENSKRHKTLCTVVTSNVEQSTVLVKYVTGGTRVLIKASKFNDTHVRLRKGKDK